MGGKNKSQTVGYWYKVLYHAGLGAGPFDAFLEFRGGDKPAWQGELTSSGTISIKAPNLWGGEKDQGGIVGDVDVMFGEATQVPSEYLLANLGVQVPAWRGLATLVFKGGKYGAMNPYPQKASYKICKIKKGWDNDSCWYPEKADVPVLAGAYASRTYTDFSGFDTNAPTKFQAGSAGIANTTINAENTDYWRTDLPGFQVSALYTKFTLNTASRGDPLGIALTDADGVHLVSFIPRSEDVYDSTQAPYINYWAAAEAIAVPALGIGVEYSFEVHLDREANSITYWLREGTTQLATGTAVLPPGVVAYLAFVRSSNANPPDISVATYSLAMVSGFTNSGAMNPAHVLYYARTNSDIGRSPIASMNDASYRAAADTLFAEGFGICTSYDPGAESLEEFEQRIGKLIGGSVNLSLLDGQYYLDLARGDYVLDDLPVLTDDDILEFSEQPSVMDGAVNSVSVKYFDPQRKEAIITSPVQALALVEEFGTIHQGSEYPEIPTGALAARVAERDLRAYVTPTRALELTTTRKPYTWRPNTYFRLQAPKRGIADMVCILGGKESGTLRSGAMRINAAQDIYSLPLSSFVEVEPGVDTRPPQTPVPVTLQHAFEVPYIEVVQRLSRADLAALPGDVGYLMAVAADPATSRDYTIRVATAGGAYTDVGLGEWCPTALVVEEADFLSLDFTLSDGKGLEQVTVGSGAFWGSELVRVDAINPATGVIRLGRACGDTVPVRHAAGTRIWFYADAVAADTTEYSSGEEISVKLLTNTGSQQLAEPLATPMSVVFDQRQLRPYAPGGFTINGAPYPASAFGPISIGAAHRDRVLQADQLVDTTATDIGPEPGTTYTVRFYADGVLEYTAVGITTFPAIYSPIGDCLLRIELEAVRDGLTSWQAHVHEIDYTVAPVDGRALESGDVRITEAGDFRILE